MREPTHPEQAANYEAACLIVDELIGEDNFLPIYKGHLNFLFQHNHPLEAVGPGTLLALPNARVLHHVNAPYIYVELVKAGEAPRELAENERIIELNPHLMQDEMNQELEVEYQYAILGRTDVDIQF